MLLRLLAVYCASALCVFAAEFSDTLSAAEKTRLGLDKLTPEQLAALNVAVEHYKQSGEAAAAAAAVDTYRKTEEPKVVTRALTEQKEQQEAGERIESRIKGKFRGWFGSTVFPLENGQVWKQVGSDTYAAPVSDSPEVEVSKSKYGHYRLRLADGAWVNVKRIR